MGLMSRTTRVPGVLASMVGAVLLVGGCGDDSDGDAEDPGGEGDGTVELADKTFVSNEVEGYELVEGTEVALVFEDDGLSVSAGCNTMSAPYVHEDGKVTWSGEPAATMMACDEALMEQDAWLAGLFTEGVEVSNNDSAADLVVESFDVRMTFVER
jgi:heat shock protein HslJ